MLFISNDKEVNIEAAIIDRDEKNVMMLMNFTNNIDLEIADSFFECDKFSFMSLLDKKETKISAIQIQNHESIEQLIDGQWLVTMEIENDEGVFVEPYRFEHGLLLEYKKSRKAYLAVGFYSGVSMRQAIEMFELGGENHEHK